MAVIGIAFSAVPLCGMEYRQSSDSFLLGTNPSGIIESPFLGASANDLNQINMGSGLTCNESDFRNYSPHNPMATGEGVSLFLGNEMLFQSAGPAGTNVLPQTTSSWRSGQQRKKHKRLQDDYDCPLKKRKLSTSTTPVVEACSPQAYWNCNQSQVRQTAVLTDFSNNPSELMHTVPSEDMEEATIETQSEATLRRIRDIESRLVVEEEEDDKEETRENRLPTLVMSDVLVESLKKGLDESLTKKIVDSMNRPSMEIVLWKPQPEFLIDKLQSIAGSSKDDSEISKQAHNTPVSSFLQEVRLLNADKQRSSTIDCDLDTTWNRDEEEMEL